MNSWPTANHQPEYHQTVGQVDPTDVVHSAATEIKSAASLWIFMETQSGAIFTLCNKARGVGRKTGADASFLTFVKLGTPEKSKNKKWMVQYKKYFLNSITYQPWTLNREPFTINHEQLDTPIYLKKPPG